MNVEERYQKAFSVAKRQADLNLSTRMALRVSQNLVRRILKTPSQTSPESPVPCMTLLARYKLRLRMANKLPSLEMSLLMDIECAAD